MFNTTRSKSDDNRPGEVSSVAQPIICCVGRSIAGQPTQFLIERLTANLRLDWKALSAEVQPEKLETASNGMLALGFKGVRWFGEYQTRAVEAFAASDSAVRFISSATSGAPSGDHWKLWDNVGPAWLDVLGRRVGSRPSVVWLHGNSRTTRSLFVALDELKSAAPLWLWTEAPPITAQSDWLTTSEQWAAEGRVSSEFSSASQELLRSWLNNLATIDTAGQAEGTSGTKPCIALVAFISEQNVMPVQIGDWLSGFSIELALSQDTALPNSLSSFTVERIAPSELAVAAEACDFERWTGISCEYQVLQDAYDEYCDF